MLGRRRGDLRDRLDALRARFSSDPVAPAESAEASLVRLEAEVERHFAKQAATRVTADRLVGALDVIPQGIVLADRTGQIVFRNRTAARYLAARHGEALVGSLIGELIVDAVAGHARTRTIELFGPPRRTLQLRALPLEAEADGPDGHGGAFLVVEDITERQRLEAVRRDFVANISHELKTPVGALGLLAETLGEERDPEVARHLAGRIGDEAFRLARTVDDLLQLSRIEVAGEPLAEEVPVSQVVRDALDRTRPAAELRSVELAADDLDASSPIVVGDRAQLVSALANLCDNAVKYSDAGDRVRIEVALDGSHVEVAVRDEGIGIPAPDLERVFERFYRVDRARSRDTGGTGLGLAIVRHVMVNHEGEVRVTSREGEGSTFTLRLPVLAPDGEPDAPEPGAPDAADGGSAVDDPSRELAR